MSSPEGRAEAWVPVAAELAHWRAAGLRPCLWWRDDDAVAPTPALEHLLGLATRHQAPLLLAVIPAFAEPALAERLRDLPLVEPCVHGFRHHNHAGAGERGQELGPHRPAGQVLAELAAGFERLQGLFGTRLRPALVPPWNRIAPAVVAGLAGLGLRGLSTFGWERFAELGAVTQVNCQVDIIDWRGGRRTHPRARVAALLAEALGTARTNGGAPVGILTHHLVHDAAAWELLEDLLSWSCREAGVTWASGGALLGD